MQRAMVVIFSTLMLLGLAACGDNGGGDNAGSGGDTSGQTQSQ
ncbi:hypothetical protein [Pararhizobium mangrovi]|nr:hypothetical protein [Pararhizobium mangrovi]